MPYLTKAGEPPKQSNLLQGQQLPTIMYIISVHLHQVPPFCPPPTTLVNKSA